MGIAATGPSASGPLDQIRALWVSPTDEKSTSTDSQTAASTASDRASYSPQAMAKAMEVRLNTLFGGERSDLAEPLQERFEKTTQSLFERFESGKLNSEQLARELDGEFTLLARDAADLLGVHPVWPPKVETVVYPLLPQFVLRSKSPAADDKSSSSTQEQMNQALRAYQALQHAATSPRGQQLSAVG